MALSSSQRALASQVNDVGVNLAEMGLLNEAVINFTTATALNPGSATYWLNLGNTYRGLGKYEKACKCFESGGGLKDTSAAFYNCWGLALFSLPRFTDAIKMYKKAISLDPSFAHALMHLGNAYRQIGWPDDALAQLEAAAHLMPHDQLVARSRLYNLNLMPSLTAEEIAQAHRSWPGSDINPDIQFDCSRDPNRRLRIGYVSSDFKMHSCAKFMFPLFENHNREKFHITAFSGVRFTDEITQKFSDIVDHWCNVEPLSDQEFIETVRSQNIDILVDCAGHTTGSRLPCFAHRLAPIQVSWLGYPNTTGLKSMDYHLSDEVKTPPGMQSLFTERLWYLPEGFHTYDPLVDTPPVASPPSVSRKYITFGASHNPAKITTPSLKLWATILDAVPKSRLHIKARAFEDTQVKSDFKDRFKSIGLDISRVSMRPWSQPYDKAFSDLNEIDVVLDATPYNGTTTSCEALWMGVPVVTLCGDRPSGRIGASLLTQIGHPEWIARSDEEYVQVACNLAGDKEKLAHIRQALRQDVQNSALGNALWFTKTVENAYRSMWQDWCDSHTK